VLLLTETYFGDLKTQVYTFEKAGDVLPEHINDETTVHITIVCKGKVCVKSMGFTREAEAGEIIDFQVNQPHEILALENNTKIINIVKTFGGVSNTHNRQ
jgi:quercetin dioxygenase-like cupin family protein